MHKVKQFASVSLSVILAASLGSGVGVAYAVPSSESAAAEKDASLEELEQGSSSGLENGEESVSTGTQVDSEGPDDSEDTDQQIVEETIDEDSVYYSNDEGEFAYISSDALSLEDLGAEPLMLAETRSSKISVIELGGVDRYETMAKEALYAFDSCDTAVVASGLGYADSIAAAGLAGSLDCPILLTNYDYVPEVTSNALKALGVKNIILLGSEDVANAKAKQQLQSIVGSDGTVERVAGADRYATQMTVYEYGKKQGFWTGDTVIVSAATGFADALSVSPVSYALKAPVFFCNESGYFPSKQESVLKGELKAKNFIVTGSETVVSRTAFDYVKKLASSRGGSAVRLGGADRYQTSQKIAEYAVKNLGFSWDNVAFASGQGPYDSLGGGVVQGKERSVLLLADGTNSSSVKIVKQSGGSISTGLKFFGSTVVVPANVRSYICSTLGAEYLGNVSYAYYGISRSKMAQLQVARNESNNYDYDDYYAALDPNQHEYGTSAFYQFAVLNNGYSGVAASSINGFVAANCIYQESNYGRTSALRNAGQYFVNAAKESGVNEAYLLAHAIWESAWGCSELASGWTPSENGYVTVNGVKYPYKKGVTYYNFYGIGAVDSGPLSGGRAMAVKEGWTSPQLAITGAAEWIASNYLNRSNPGQQNTLYLMKWDLSGAAKTGSAWHEYCTGLDSWVLGIARIMGNCYSYAGKSFDETGLAFSVPVYSGN